MSFPLTAPSRISNLVKNFSLQSLEFYTAYSFKSEKDWPVDFAKLWNRESDSVYNHVIIWLLKTTVLSLKYSINLALVVSLEDV